ncbi:MAG: chaperone activator Sti1 [Amphiamblys sp. WSBS2006]|nr:MAG: chaperone activator Sti1 [Amphiamblys sp. WSBS2006]
MSGRLETRSTPPMSAPQNEKETGNALYKEKRFEEAITHYEAAWNQDTTDISVLTNQAAAYLEMGNYDKSIELCALAVEKGRDAGAEFRLIGKAFARAGNAHMKKEQYEDAIECYKKSLTEHRTDGTLQSLKLAEKKKVEQAKKTLHDPVLGEKARAEGTALFKEGKYPEAIEKYTEAIRRNDQDAKAYANRAAAYMKLLAYTEAMNDCNACLQIDPAFIKAHIRKSEIELAQKQHVTALCTCEDAEQVDTGNRFSADLAAQREKIYNKTMEARKGKSQEEIMREAASDPALMKILKDPEVKTAISEMEKNPKTAVEKMGNPALARKIMILHASGILGFK